MKRLKSPTSDGDTDETPDATPSGDRDGDPEIEEGDGGVRRNPALDAPEWGRDRSDLCPDCVGKMDRFADGQKVEVRRPDGVVVSAEADRTDRVCHSCSVVVTESGEQLEYVN